MKKLAISALLVLLTINLFAQFKFDFGIKGGVNFSKLSLNAEDYSAESVTKTHLGAFTRFGWERIFIQPELYFSGKGGDVSDNVFNTVTSFDFKTFDIPVLLGFRVIKRKPFDLHITAGPVFSKITSEDISSSDWFNQAFYNNSYIGIQYGLGIDILFFTFDARMENGLSEFYSQPGVSGKNNTFMLSLGFKFL